ncbi:hypothetical protein, partial [Thauera sinica]
KQSAGVLLDFDRFGVSFGLSSVVTINVFSLRFQRGQFSWMSCAFVMSVDGRRTSRHASMTGYTHL